MRCDGGEEDLTDNIMEYLVCGVTPTSLQSGRGEIAEELVLMVEWLASSHFSIVILVALLNIYVDLGGGRGEG